MAHQSMTKFQLLQQNGIAQLWIAAHFSRKIDKDAVKKINIVNGMQTIEKLAKQITQKRAENEHQYEKEGDKNENKRKNFITLRDLAQLMYGLVRIWEKQAKTFYEEATHVYGKIKFSTKHIAAKNTTLQPPIAQNTNAHTVEPVRERLLELPEITVEEVVRAIMSQQEAAAAETSMSIENMTRGQSIRLFQSDASILNEQPVTAAVEMTEQQEFEMGDAHMQAIENENDAARREQVERAEMEDYDLEPMEMQPLENYNEQQPQTDMSMLEMGTIEDQHQHETQVDDQVQQAIGSHVRKPPTIYVDKTLELSSAEIRSNLSDTSQLKQTREFHVLSELEEILHARNGFQRLVEIPSLAWDDGINLSVHAPEFIEAFHEAAHGKLWKRRKLDNATIEEEGSNASVHPANTAVLNDASSDPLDISAIESFEDLEPMEMQALDYDQDQHDEAGEGKESVLHEHKQKERADAVNLAQAVFAEQDRDVRSERDEAYAQPEHGLTEQVLQTARMLRLALEDRADKNISFNDAFIDRETASKPSRLQAARNFYQLLVLRTNGYIDIEQPAPFDNIQIMATDRFSTITPML